MQHQRRQSEGVRAHVALRDGVLVADVVVHLGQHLGAVLLAGLAKPVENPINIRFDQEAATANSLGGVAEGIQAKQLDPARGEKGDVLLHQLVGLLGLII